jgi:hypothetical protein
MVPSLAALRPFGRAQDLDLEFTDADRPALVTALLAGCDAKSSAEFWWEQTVGARIAALLRVLELTEGDALPATLRCAEPGCGTPFEVTLPFAALQSAAPADDVDTAEPIIVPLSGGRSAALRRPTGRDLRIWRRARCASRREAVAAMLDALVVTGAAGPDDEPAIAEAMSASDPLVAFAVFCACPACGAERDRPIDLEAIALAQLNARQRALLRQIHVLASSYGWTEGDVLTVAPARRARYLALIEDGS